MGLKLIYQMLGKLLSWMALHARSEVRKRTAVWGSLEQAAPSRPLPHRAPTEIRKNQRHDRVGGLLHKYQHVA